MHDVVSLPHPDTGVNSEPHLYETVAVHHLRLKRDALIGGALVNKKLARLEALAQQAPTQKPHIAQVKPVTLTGNVTYASCA